MMMKNKIRVLREQLGYTQADLADLTNLSIRTIQRVESGQTIPKGHTLNVLATALAVDKIELQQQPSTTAISEEEDLKLKLINLSTLCFLGIPFGNILVPFLIWDKNRAYPKVNEVGRKIINFQILWSLCTVILLICSPFLQDYFPYNFSLMLTGGLLAVGVNLFFIFKTARSLMQAQYEILPLKIRFI